MFRADCQAWFWRHGASCCSPTVPDSDDDYCASTILDSDSSDDDGDCSDADDQVEALPQPVEVEAVQVQREGLPPRIQCDDPLLDGLQRYCDKQGASSLSFATALKARKLDQAICHSPLPQHWSGQTWWWRGINDLLDKCENTYWYEGCLPYLIDCDGPLDVSVAFSLAKAFIQSQVQCTQKYFKIGITSSPHFRWTRTDGPGYEHGNNFPLTPKHLKILWISHRSKKKFADSSGRVETDLIAIWNQKTHPFAVNKEGAGGEGAPRGPYHFTYVTW